MAPIKAITQYVPILIFPILIEGKNSMEAVIVRNVIEEIIIVGIIKTQPLLSALFIKSVSKLFKI